jgi:hypothetical protein
MTKLKIILIALLLIGAANAAAQEEGGGQGSVNISQDQRLQNIVSGETPVVERKQETGASDNKEQVKKKSSSGNANRTSAPRKIQRTQIVDVKDLPTFGNRSANDFDVRTGARRRLRGFRIQMFWGNSLRTDQLRAKRLGDKVTGAFPELKAYVTFQQPHWRCRVGDFKTRAGAARYLDKMRKIAPEAMIVRSEIVIYQ